MLKALNGITVLSGVTVYAVDPTVMVAAIMAGASIISTLATLTFGFLIRRDNRELKMNQDEMKHNVNGALSKLIGDKEIQAAALLNTKENLAHAEGRLEAIVIPVATPSDDAVSLKDLVARVTKMEKKRK